MESPVTPERVWDGVRQEVGWPDSCRAWARRREASDLDGEVGPVSWP